MVFTIIVALPDAAMFCLAAAGSQHRPLCALSVDCVRRRPQPRGSTQLSPFYRQPRGGQRQQMAVAEEREPSAGARTATDWLPSLVPISWGERGVVASFALPCLALLCLDGRPASQRRLFTPTRFCRVNYTVVASSHAGSAGEDFLPTATGIVVIASLARILSTAWCTCFTYGHQHQGGFIIECHLRPDGSTANLP